MKVTIATQHGNTFNFKEEHNYRVNGHFDKNRIDEGKIQLNEQWANPDKRPVRELVNEYFKPYIDEYNAKQKRADRKIDYDYYSKFWSDSMYGDSKLREAKEKSKTPYPIYEMVVGVYDGYTEELNGGAKLSEEEQYKILREYFDEWSERNPNLHIMNASLHRDEANLNLHIDYCPVGEKYKKGLSKQISMSKALEEQGFISQGKNHMLNAEAQWNLSENVALEKICQRHGHEVVHYMRDDADAKREHLAIRDYIKAKEKADIKVNEVQKEANTKINQMNVELEFKAEDIQIMDAEINKKRRVIKELSEKEKLNDLIKEAPSFMWENYQKIAKSIDDKIAIADDEEKIELSKNRSLIISKKMSKEVIYPKCKENFKWKSDEWNQLNDALFREIKVCRERDKLTRSIGWYQRQNNLTLKDACLTKAQAEIRKDISNEYKELNGLNSELRRLKERIKVTNGNDAVDRANKEKEALLDRINQKYSQIQSMKDSMDYKSREIALGYLQELTPDDFDLFDNEDKKIIRQFDDKASKLIFYMENDVDIAIDYINANKSLQDDTVAEVNANNTRLDKAKAEAYEKACKIEDETIKSIKESRTMKSKIKGDTIEMPRETYNRLVNSHNMLYEGLNYMNSSKYDPEGLKEENSDLKSKLEEKEKELVETKDKLIKSRQGSKELYDNKEMAVHTLETVCIVKEIDPMEVLSSTKGIEVFSKVSGQNKSDVQKGLEETERWLHNMTKIYDVLHNVAEFFKNLVKNKKISRDNDEPELFI